MMCSINTRNQVKSQRFSIELSVRSVWYALAEDPARHISIRTGHIKEGCSYSLKEINKFRKWNKIS